MFMLFLVDILVYNYGFSACILMKILFVEWYLMKIQTQVTCPVVPMLLVYLFSCILFPLYEFIFFSLPEFFISS